METRDIALKFCGRSLPTRRPSSARRDAFVSFLKEGIDGWLDMIVPELGRHYHVYYKDCSDYEHLKDIGGGHGGGAFHVKFREPNPEF